MDMTSSVDITILDISSEPCDECQRRGWDPPWQLVVRLEYACARTGGVVTVSLCLAQHLTEFLAGYFDSVRQADDRHQVECDGGPESWSSPPVSASQRDRAGFR
jgi:hypothetical protein